jgi:hypothetical protein
MEIVTIKNVRVYYKTHQKYIRKLFKVEINYFLYFPVKNYFTKTGKER